jgi:hypothetical protein
MRSDLRNRIWIIPLLAVLYILLFFLYTRLGIGGTSEQQFEFGTHQFVPAQSPYSTGADSR